MPGSETKTSHIVIRLEQLRGLIIHYKKTPAYRRPRQYQRSLIHSLVGLFK